MWMLRTIGVAWLLFVAHSYAHVETAAAGTCAKDPRVRVDCYPFVPHFPNATEEACLAQGCCWKKLDNYNIPCAYDDRGASDPERCVMVPSASRIACRNPRYFTIPADRVTCEMLGCCFDEEISGEQNHCFQPFFEGYELLGLDEQSDGWRGVLALRRPKRGPFGNDVSLLALHVIRESRDRVRVRITDSAFPRYEVPEIPVRVHEDEDTEQASKYQVHFTERPFGIAVTRRKTGEVLFNSTPPIELNQSFNGLVFENQFLEISTQLASDDSSDDGPVLYGLGERVSPLRIRADSKGDHYPMFSRDQPATEPHTRQGGDNLYGVHPFYLQLEDSGRAHGVFFLSSNAMEVVTQFNALTFRTVGGILDFFVFVGPTADEVVSQYTQVVGRPEMPPYWALGYHLGRQGYTSVNDSISVVNRMRDAGIPLDAHWLDIDYMNAGIPFSLDERNFPQKEMKRFIDDLHFHNQYSVVAQMSAIASEVDNVNSSRGAKATSLFGEGSLGENKWQYEPLIRGNKLDVFVKGVQGEKYAEKYVQSHWSVFIDFFHPNATQYWHEQLSFFHENVLPFDGIWIDMNEPTSTCDAEYAAEVSICQESEHRTERRSVDSDDEITYESLDETRGEGGFVRSGDVAFPFDPYRQPFVPGQGIRERGGHGNLNSATLPMAALHYGSLHYNLHSLYGHAQSKATRETLDKIIRKRSLFLSRSTFAGDGQFTGHWLGENAATWENLRLSIAGVLQMNMFGIPLVGPNVCGYHLDTTKQLCVRWHQAASFFPLIRNHARKYTRPQAPVDFDEEVVNILRDTLLRRYRYLPYMYTLFYRAHLSGSPIVRPLAFQFPMDNEAKNVEYQYMLGSALMVSPVVQEDSISVHIYFPNATWYDAENGKLILEPTDTKARSMQLLTLLPKLQLHVRGGSIVPMQKPSTTTTLSRGGAYTLLAALDRAPEEKPSACGELFIDDGDSLNSIEDNRYSTLEFGAFQNTSFTFDMKSKVSFHGYDGPEMQVPLNEIKVYGLTKGFHANSSIHATMSIMDRNNQSVHGRYFAQENILLLSQLNLLIGQDFHIHVLAVPGVPTGEEDGTNHAKGGGESEGNERRGSDKDDEESEDQGHDGAIGGGTAEKTKSTRYSTIGIIGTIVGIAFLVGLCVTCVLQRRRNAGYNPIL